MADPNVDLSVVVLSWNTHDLTVACLSALKDRLDAWPRSTEVIVIDNASSDDSAATIERDFKWVQLHINAENVGYARGVNQGLALAKGCRVMLLGSDTEVRGETIPSLWDFLDGHPDVGMVAPKCVDPDGTLQRGCMRFPDLKTALYYDTLLEKLSPDNTALNRYFYKDWDHVGTRSVDQPPATSVMVRREVIDEVGPMDKRLWLLFNDVDWCLRIHRAGWEIYYVDEATEVLHHRGASTSRRENFAVDWHRDRLYFYRKHYHAMGAFIAKMALLYVGGREVLRIRRNLESTSEFIKHSKQVIRAMGGVLLRG